MSNINGNIVASIVNDDLYTFALDTNLSYLQKIEYSGEIVDSLSLKEESTFSVKNKFGNYSLALDANEMIRVYDIAYYWLYKINPENLEISERLQIQSGRGQNFTIDLHNNIIIGNWESVAVDEYNRIYTIEQADTFPDVSFSTYPNNVYRYDLSNVSSSDSVIYLNDYQKQDIVVVNEFYEDITFNIFYKNSQNFQLLSKPFNPQTLVITKDNYLCVGNDTAEILKLKIFSDYILYKNTYNIFNPQICTGKNFEDISSINGLEEYVDTPLWSELSATNLNTIQFAATYEQSSEKEQDDFFWIIDSNNKILNKTDSSFERVACFFLPDSLDPINTSDEDFMSYSFTKPPITAYDWHRKYTWINGGKLDNNFSASVYTLSGNNISKNTLSSSTPLYDKQWYHIALTYDKPSGVLKMYLDNILVSEKVIDANQDVYNFFDNGVVIGATQLKTGTINSELNCNMYSFNGQIYDTRIYDYELTQSKLANIILESIKIEPIEWNIQVNKRQYMEQIERFFMNRVPGNASQFYKIKLSGFDITDQSIKNTIEEIVKQNIERISPAYTTLYGIEWE